MESKVCLTLKFTPHTCPKHSRAQLLVPNENCSQRSAGCGDGVSTKNQSPPERSSDGKWGGASTWVYSDRHREYKSTLKGTPLSRLCLQQRKTGLVCSAGDHCVLCSGLSCVPGTLQAWPHSAPAMNSDRPSLTQGHTNRSSKSVPCTSSPYSCRKPGGVT